MIPSFYEAKQNEFMIMLLYLKFINCLPISIIIYYLLKKGVPAI